MSLVRPTTPSGVADEIAARIGRIEGRCAIVFDGAAATSPEKLALAVAERMPSRPVVQVSARSFWRQASLRLEHGHTDPDAWVDDWLDATTLQREVLDPVHADPTTEVRTVLPALRDPFTDRALRASRVELGPNGIVMVSGAGLLGRLLTFDLAVHLHLSHAALARRTSPEETWTLPALARYEDEFAPDAEADIVVRWDDERHPAIQQ